MTLIISALIATATAAALARIATSKRRRAAVRVKK